MGRVWRSSDTRAYGPLEPNHRNSRYIVEKIKTRQSSVLGSAEGANRVALPVDSVDAEVNEIKTYNVPRNLTICCAGQGPSSSK